MSTPRSGSNWLQHLLSHVYRLPRPAPTTVDNVPWAALPEEGVLILHWHRRPDFVRQLQRHGFRVVSLVRHPFDVLLSILHFTLLDPTDAWLWGEGGNEQAILGVHPRSEAFLRYATGPRAAALLSVSRQWWHDPKAVKVRYEDLCSAPEAELARLVDALKAPPRRRIAAAVRTTTLARLRQRHPNRQHHFWQGRPGLWRKLFTADDAARLAAAHADLLDELSYRCDPDPTLTGEQADANWLRLLDPAGTPAPTADVETQTARAALEKLKQRLQQCEQRLAYLESARAGTPLTRTLRRLKGRLARWIAVTREFVGG